MCVPGEGGRGRIWGVGGGEAGRGVAGGPGWGGGGQGRGGMESGCADESIAQGSYATCFAFASLGQRDPPGLLQDFSRRVCV